MEKKVAYVANWYNGRANLTEIVIDQQTKKTIRVVETRPILGFIHVPQRIPLFKDNKTNGVTCVFFKRDLAIEYLIDRAQIEVFDLSRDIDNISEEIITLKEHIDE